MKKLVVSTGAGISAESGLSTYRDSNGLWNNYPVMEVASHTGFVQNPALIHKFYNELRHQLVKAQPNAAHFGLVELEQSYDVRVITQNVDDLHERAGSKNVLHLHGELMKMRSMRNPSHVYQLPLDNLDTDLDTRDQYGDPVRPHIVFFEEDVPNFSAAAQLAAEADIFVIIGTSLAVYPAASLLSYVRASTPVYYIDPRPVGTWRTDIVEIAKPATTGIRDLISMLQP